MEVPLPTFTPGRSLVIDLSVVETANSIGGFSPKPPIGGRLRPPNPLQKLLFCCQFIFLAELYCNLERIFNGLNRKFTPYFCASLQLCLSNSAIFLQLLVHEVHALQKCEHQERNEFLLHQQPAYPSPIRGHCLTLNFAQ